MKLTFPTQLHRCCEPDFETTQYPTARWGPPTALLVRQIIASTSPILQQIDEEYAPTTSK